jgi:outer membrane autotransporter protein
MGSSASPPVGRKYILIDNKIETDIGATTIFTQTETTGLYWPYLELKYDLDYINGGSLTAELTEIVGASPLAKALPESFLSGTIILNQGADLAAEKALPLAVGAAAGSSGWNVYSAFGVSHMKYETGSSVEVEGFSIQIGLAHKFDFSSAGLTMGVFFEGGQGNYDTFNSFSKYPDVKGHGKTDYLGGGILGRVEATVGTGHLYGEATFRIGRVRSDYLSDDLLAAYSDYSVSSPYYGFHLGAGYGWDITEKVGLDLYTKYFQTVRRGEDIKTPVGVPVSFEEVTSQRIRAGTRLSTQIGEQFRPYMGVAWENEFDGEAKASVYGYSIDSPKMKGDTGVAELGVTTRLTSGGGALLDVGIQGYTGQRKGITGGASVKFEF